MYRSAEYSFDRLPKKLDLQLFHEDYTLQNNVEKKAINSSGIHPDRSIKVNDSKDYGRTIKSNDLYNGKAGSRSQDQYRKPL